MFPLFHHLNAWYDGTGCHELCFWMLSFKPAFSFSSFTFIKRLFSSTLLSAIRVVSSAYLRLLIFLLAILIPGFVSSSLACHLMYSAYKLNKQGDNIEPWCTPFPILNQCVVHTSDKALISKYIKSSFSSIAKIVYKEFIQLSSKKTPQKPKQSN